MPPKPKKNEPSKKTEQKKKEKIVEDKTFGMKNKKGAKQQKFIQQVQQQVHQQGKNLEKEKAEKMTKKEEKKKEAEELNTLFKPVEQKIAKGADPKSVLCAFFKAGQCVKGDRCKFSHDLNIGRKGEKRSVYEDQRDENDTMENWDEAKLEEVVSKKHGESNKNKPKTDIICKYFIDALENSKYGWFWQCPNGELCIYRHALPPGFVLKKDQKKINPEDVITLEELIEKQRAALNSQNLTKVTLESFLKWKERKRKEKLDKAYEESEKKKANFSAGKMFGISGREMFEFNPDLVEGDEIDGEDFVYSRDSDDDEGGEQNGPVREINLLMFAEENQEYIELPPSVDAGSRLANLSNISNHQDEDDLSKLGAAAASAVPTNSLSNGNVIEEIDENLFDEDEDFDNIDEALDNLEIEDK